MILKERPQTGMSTLGAVMSKGILEFDLPEESEEFETAVKAGDLQCVLQNMDNYLRGLVKYESEGDIMAECGDKIRTRFWAFIQERSINMW